MLSITLDRDTGSIYALIHTYGECRASVEFTLGYIELTILESPIRERRYHSIPLHNIDYRDYYYLDEIGDDDRDNVLEAIGNKLAHKLGLTEEDQRIIGGSLSSMYERLKKAEKVLFEGISEQ